MYKKAILQKNAFAVIKYLTSARKNDIIDAIFKRNDRKQVECVWAFQRAVGWCETAGGQA